MQGKKGEKPLRGSHVERSSGSSNGVLLQYWEGGFGGVNEDLMTVEASKAKQKRGCIEGIQ